MQSATAKQVVSTEGRCSILIIIIMVAMSGDLLMFTFFVFYSLYDMFLIRGRSQLYAVVIGTRSPIVCMFVYFVWSHSSPLFVLL